MYLILSWHLWTLTVVRDIPPSHVELTPTPSLQPSTAAAASEFDRIPASFEAQDPISALNSRLPHAGLSCETFREEPADTGLDWPFTPSPRSSGWFACQLRFGPPPLFREASPYPGLDRAGFGSYSHDSGRFHTPSLALAVAGAADLSLSLRLRALNP